MHRNPLKDRVCSCGGRKHPHSGRCERCRKQRGYNATKPRTGPVGPRKHGIEGLAEDMLEITARNLRPILNGKKPDKRELIQAAKALDWLGGKQPARIHADTIFALAGLDWECALERMNYPALREKCLRLAGL